MGVLKLNLRRCFSKFQCSHCLTLSATFACSPLGVEDIPKKVTESRSWWFKSHKLDIFHHFFTFFPHFSVQKLPHCLGGSTPLRRRARSTGASTTRPSCGGSAAKIWRGRRRKRPGKLFGRWKTMKKNGGKWWNCWVSSGQKNETLWNMEIDAPGQLRIVICYLSICWSPWRIEITILDGLV